MMDRTKIKRKLVEVKFPDLENFPAAELVRDTEITITERMHGQQQDFL